MAMKPLKTAHDMFYFVEDVMQILGYSKSKSYKVIKSLNRELENQGKCTSSSSYRPYLPCGQPCSCFYLRLSCLSPQFRNAA